MGQRGPALTCSSAQSSLMSHSGLSGPDSAVGLANVGRGLANCVCCFNRMFFFCSFPSRRIFNMPGVARSNSERGGTTGSPWRCFFFLPATARRAFVSQAARPETAPPRARGRNGAGRGGRSPWSRWRRRTHPPASTPSRATGAPPQPRAQTKTR